MRVQAAGQTLGRAPTPVLDVHGRVGEPGPWRLKRAPTSRSYHGHFPRVSDAAWTPTIAAAVLDEALERAPLGALAIGVPVFDRKIDDVVARQDLRGELRLAFAVVSTEKRWRSAEPLDGRAPPSGIESWRKPVVFVNTSAEALAIGSRAASCRTRTRASRQGEEEHTQQRKHLDEGFVLPGNEQTWS